MSKRSLIICAVIIACVALALFTTRRYSGNLEAASIFFVLVGIVITWIAIRSIWRGEVEYKDGSNHRISRELHPVGFWIYSSWDLMVGIGIIAATVINYYAKN